MRDRAGEVVAQVVKTTDSETLQGAILASVMLGSTVCTDEHRSCSGFEKLFDHKFVCRSAKQFIDGIAHTNGTENVWAILKRGFYGTHHSFSAKHVSLYVDEFVSWMNKGNCEIGTTDRPESLVKG